MTEDDAVATLRAIAKLELPNRCPCDGCEARDYLAACIEDARDALAPGDGA